VLFNPALVLAPIEGTQSVGFEKEMTAERFGCPPAEISPAHNVKAGAPPAIIFHGKADTTVAYESAEIFTHRMKAAGNRCELVSFDGQGHGFFNFGKTGDKFAHETLTGADRFLASLGWLQGEPTVETFFTTNPPSPSKK
jgi:acetyl esterase/lipase